MVNKTGFLFHDFSLLAFTYVDFEAQFWSGDNSGPLVWILVLVCSTQMVLIRKNGIGHS